MKKKMSEHMNKLFSDKGHSFYDNITKQNITKILVIGSIYCGFEIVGLIMSTLGFFESDIRAYVSVIVLLHIVYIPSVYIFNKKIDVQDRAGMFKLKALERVYYYGIFLWASIFNVLVYLGDKDITIYSSVALLIAAMFVLKPLAVRFLYIINFAIFTSMIYMSMDNHLIANGLVFKGLIVTVIAMVIAHTNFTIRKNLFESNNQLHEMNLTLRDQALRDSLTKLYNNGYMFDFIENAIKDQDRCGSVFSLLMIDIDDFKLVNDKYGHLFGDQVICGIADKLKELTRSHDVVGRYGGEEFVIALCGADVKIASDIAERIRKEVEELQFEEPMKVSISVGISEYSNQTTMELVKTADENLYKAKRAGKNRVVA